MSSGETYCLYGLRVRSDLPLPAVPVPDDGSADLVVRHCGAIARPTCPPPAAMIDWRQTSDGWLLRYSNRTGELLEFSFSPDASEIEIRSTISEATQDIAALLVGAVVASALHLRGHPALHASAVIVDQRAIVLAGMAGAGKSTLTAALVAKGVPLLAEDLAVLKFGKDVTAVQSGYPRLRLWPDAVSVVGKAASDLPRVFSFLTSEDKRWVNVADLAGGFCATPAPLGGIYLLAPRRPARETLTIEPLPAHRAALALLVHLYGERWLRTPKAKALAWCARIAGQTPVSVVHAPPGLDRIGETAEAIVVDCRRSSPAASRVLDPAATA